MKSHHALTPPIVIMAGGEGARIGGNKPMQNVAGVSLITRVLDFARRHSPHVAVSARATDQFGNIMDTLEHDDKKLCNYICLEQDSDKTKRYRAVVLLDPMPGHGPVNALISAFAFGNQLGCQNVFVIGCDMPLLPDDLVSRLSASMSGYSAAIAHSAGRLHPAAGLWKVEEEKLARYIETGRRSLVGYAESVGYTAVDWSTDRFDPFFNVNTPQDVATVENILKKAML